MKPGLTITMTTERANPVSCFRAGSLDVTQQQRPDREALHVGEGARVLSPAGAKKEEKVKKRQSLKVADVIIVPPYV